MSDFLLSSFQRPFVLSGAGISAESNLATFRGADGLWEGHRIEDVATPEAFDRDPRLVWTFYSMRREAAFRAVPNVAHVVLADVCAQNRAAVLVTQNVDGLHERAHRVAGAKPPLAMHGRLEVTKCERCERTWADRRSYFDAAGTLVPEKDFGLPEATDLLPLPKPERDRQGLPRSSCCGARLRPDIVWFGETPYLLEEIFAAVEECDVFVAVGTSGQVFPAAGLLAMAREQGIPTVVVNADAPANLDSRDRYFQGLATRWIPELCAR